MGENAPHETPERLAFERRERRRLRAQGLNEDQIKARMGECRCESAEQLRQAQATAARNQALLAAAEGE